ncbi:hypothetical protein [Mycobacterium sp. 1245499.0]|uniref:hypothetical protein n=1 Tax=Mycobacterium sp. 1245499.0 TaxID=1834074 RepID=UPI000A7594FA|nr:hypothetical protein [Mycobacterium sp. 1245499.0]
MPRSLAGDLDQITDLRLQLVAALPCRPFAQRHGLTIRDLLANGMVTGELLVLRHA